MEKPNVKLEDGIPFPYPHEPQRHIYPYREMKVGQSFLVKGTKTYVYQLVWRWMGETDFQLVVAKTEEGYRVWRSPDKKRRPDNHSILNEELDTDKMWQELLEEEKRQAPFVTERLVDSPESSESSNGSSDPAV